MKETEQNCRNWRQVVEQLTVYQTHYTISLKLDEAHMMTITYSMQMHREFITTLPKENTLIL